MESVNTVRTSTVMVSRWVRQWSRITSTKPLLTVLALLMVCLFGVNESAWGECDYTLNDAVLSKTHEHYRTIFVKLYKINDFVIGNVDNVYGISHIKVTGKFDGFKTGSANQTFTLQYRVNNGSWQNLGSGVNIGKNKNNNATTIYDADVNIAGGADKKVYFKLSCANPGTDFTDTNYPLVLTVNIRMATTASMPSALNIGDVAVDGSEDGEMYFTHSNRNGQTITFSSSQSAFEVSPSSVTLGCSGSEKITVTYKPTCGNKPTSAIITAKYGNTTLCSSTVSATPTLNAQTVNWELGKATSLVAGTNLDVAGFATSTSDIDGKPAIYYTSLDPTVISVASDGHTLVANDKKAGYSATITAHQDADCKYGEATADQVFTVTAKDRPEFTLYVGGVATEATSANLKVGDVVEIHYANAPNLQVSGGSSTTFTHSENTTSKIVTVTAQGVCTNGELTLYESGNMVVEERTVKFTFNISKHETSLSSLLDVTNFYVGNSVYDATAYNFTKGTAYNTNNTEVTVQFSSTDKNVINVENGQLKALKAGKAKVTISQAENNKWTGASVEQEITVKKHEATFDWKAGANYTWNQSISNPFTTDNHDTQITCVSDDTNVADYVDGKVVIYNVTGTAHFTLHQDSSDVWAETSQQYTVTVSKVSNHVEFTYTQAMYNDENITVAKVSSKGTACDGNGKLRLGGSDTGIGIGSPAYDYDDKYVDIKFSGVPSQLSFQIATNANAATGEYWYVKESSNGSNWSGEKWKSEHEGESFSSTQTVDLSPDTRYVRLCYSGNFAGYFKNIKVTERREVKPHESADVDCGTANHGSDPTEVKAILEWYNVKPLTCSITSDHPEAFELVTTSIDSKLDTYKKNQEITIRGKHDVTAGKYTGTLHVTNGTESTTFNLTTETTKQTPVITWKENLSPMSVGDVVADAARAGSATIKYTVDGTYLTLDENGAVVATNATDEEGVDLIAYVEEDQTWYAQSETIKVVVTNLLKQTITWNDKLSLKFTATKEIDLTATASSDLPVKYELSGTGSYAHLNADSTKLVITGIGKTLYLTANQEGDAEYYPASQTKLINSRDPNATCDHILYEDYSETTLHTIDWKNIEWNLSDGEPGRITFKIKRMTAAAGSMAIEEYYDGSWHRKETYSGLSTSYGEAKEVNLNRKTTKISIGAPTGATLRHYVKDIVLHQAKYIEGIPSVRDFGTVTMGTAKQMTFDVKYSNLSKSLDLEIKNENGHFTVDRAYIGDDCGEHGTVTVKVTYTASEYRTTQEVDSLIISNNENRYAVALKANVQKASQTITWDPTLSLKTTDVIAFDAVTTDAAAATGIEVTYAVKGESDVATVTTDGHLSILKDGQVTIIASAEGNSQYENATPIEKTFTISKVTPTITNNPTISAITLPATLSNVAIDADDATAEDDKHNAVTGSFAWQTGSTKVLSGANDYAIVFTPNQPTGKDWYNEVVYNISVTGNQDSQTIIWSRADETTQPCSTPTTFDAYSNKGLDITYVSDNEAIAHVEKVDDEYRLVVTTSGTVHITAKQLGNGDYLAAENVTKTIKLTREQPVIVTPPTADDIFTDNLLKEAGLSDGEGQVNGVHAEGIFAWKNGDIQPEYGTHSYTATFTPSPAAWYYPAECQVDVTVKKHPHTISWGYAGGTIYVDKDDLYFSGATSSAELTNIYYTTSNAEIAEVDKTDGNKLIIHGKGTIDIIARSEGNTIYDAAEQRRSLTILPLATTIVNDPTAEGIAYGQALSTSALSGGLVKGSDDAVLDGTWAWNDDAEILNADENAQSREVTFTPNDSHWYASATTNALVVVAKAEPTTISATTTIIYGQLLSEATLVNTTTGVFGEAVSGNVVWATSVDQSEALEIGTHNVAIHFTSASNNYTDGDGECVVTVMEGVVFKGGTNTSWGEEGNWINGNQPTNSDRVTVDADVEITNNVTIGGITINAGNTVTVKSGATLTIGDKDSYVRGEYGSIHVENGGNLNLTGGRLAVKDFTLDAQLGNTTNDLTLPSASGQVLGANKLDVNGDAFFQLEVDPCGHNTYGWYDFVVPFEVDVIGGISIAEAPTTPMQFNVNYAVMAYDESKRAVKGKDWNKFSGTMQPGRVYTISLDETQPWNTVIFKKKKGAAITGDRSFTTSYSGLGETKDNGWNGFGNGSLQHMELDVTDPETLVQIYDHANKCYQPRLAKDRSIAVGLSFFMQVGGVETIELSPAVGNDRFMAPTRTKASVDKFCLALKADEEEQASDYFWVSANEEATGEYVIGRDVLKMGALTSSKVARIWSNRNDINLCSNDIPMVDNQANCSISLFAPQAKTYTLSVENTPEDATLYLTYNDRIIWSLSASPYVMDLEAGTTEGYGLRIVTTSRMPEIATGVESLDAEQGAGMRKVMIDNKIYIITPEGAMYDVTGKILR